MITIGTKNSSTTKFFTSFYHNCDVVEYNWWKKNDESIFN